MKKTLLLLLLACPLLAPSLAAQEGDLLSLLGDEETTDYATASFKTNRIVNGHSIENTAPGVLDFKISHRFAPLRQGIYDVFGLDNAAIRIGFDYGITPRLMVGFGRNSNEKIIDGFVKYKVLRQSSGKRNMPLSLSYLVDAQIKTVKFSDETRDNKFSSRLYYTHQLLLARKFNAALTLQLMPTLVHRNLVATRGDKNDVFAIGAGGRIKLTKRVALNAEYYYVPEGQISQDFANSLSIGFDIETGGHVFQLHFTNSNDMTYKGFITETSEDWFFRNAEDRLLSGIRFGFNVSRVFTIRKPKGLD
jgi:opacity protein-like surface antigen